MNKNNKSKTSNKTLKQLMKYIIKGNKLPLIIVTICILITALLSASTSVFLANIIDRVITPVITSTKSVSEVLSVLKVIITIYIIFALIGVIATFIYTRIMAVLTQKILDRLRKEMFDKMMSFPLRYFDQHPHGDIMSVYTNDIDSLRQFISQTLVQLVVTIFTVIQIVIVMLFYSFYLSLLVAVGIVVIILITKKISSKMGVLFKKQQEEVGALEGFVEEMMDGQRVVKVFNYEERSYQKFNELNSNIQKTSSKANQRGNILMPIIGNVGHLVYILTITFGSILIGLKVANPSFQSFITGNYLLTAGTVVGFVTICRQLTQSIGQITQQLPAYGMALAGAHRVFELLESTSELDEGDVTMVRGKYENKKFIETHSRFDKCYWKIPTNNNVIYKEVLGHIILDNVTFEYVKGKTVLNDVSVYANPGEQIALVGSTGAGKTTITNLINRFYEISNGSVLYDGINIKHIAKKDLRRSLGIVLQDTNLFTGTIKENIAYGNPEATDEEIIEAAKTANAYNFIMTLKDGFDTVLLDNASMLSLGQRQLLSIARAACANTPVMILDEATSSIDTKTEVDVQKGMTQLMEGRTVFIIAHRLSTIRNSDCIMVLEHGKIIEKGNHESLMLNKKTYYSFYTGKIELS